MSTSQTGRADAAAQQSGERPGEPSEAELRAAYEEELSRITSSDMILQAAVSLLNIGGRRLGRHGGSRDEPEGGSAQQARAPGEAERDLEQVRDAIDAVRGLLAVLERRLPTELGPLRDALSQLQIAYAREVQASGHASAGASPATGAQQGPGGAGAPAPVEGEGAAAGPQEEQPGAKGPGPAEASGRLWVPGR